MVGISAVWAMGTHIYYCEAGRGQHMKLANQIMIAGTLSGVSRRSPTPSSRNGSFDGHLLSEGWCGRFRQLELLGPKMVAEDYAPGFFIKHFIKDMRLALEESQKEHLRLQILEAVLSHFEELAQEGYDEMGTQQLITFYLPPKK
ncbi:MAG: NAD-binding protein [Merdibacter sp.]